MYGTSSLTIVQTTVYKRNKKWERYRNKTSAPEGSKGEVRRETGDIDSKKYSPVKGGNCMMTENQSWTSLKSVFK